MRLQGYGFVKLDGSTKQADRQLHMNLAQHMDADENGQECPSSISFTRIQTLPCF